MTRTRQLLLVATCLFLVACNDRTTIPPIFFEPPDEVDAGSPRDGGGGDASATLPPDGICNTRADGASCSLPSAAGICVRQRCRLVACLTGFDDCDDAPGCETNIRSEASCGACDTSCPGEATCSAGPGGYVCAKGIVCPTDRFDLDSDRENGCEWKADWDGSWPVVPADLQISVLDLEDGQPVVAGISEQSRISTLLGTTPAPTVWQLPNPPAEAVSVDYDDDWLQVVWTDGVSTLRTADQARGFVEPTCEAPEGPRRLVGASDDLVASAFELFRIDTGETCSGNACLEPAYTWVDYLRQSLPLAGTSPQFGFTTDELTACDTCLFADDGTLTTLAECAGARQCRRESFDDTACAGCSAAGCPTLDIVDVVDTPNALIVVTARGFLALDPADLSLIYRAEEPFDPNTAGGPRYVGAVADETGVITLLHSDGYGTASSIDTTAVPATAAPVHPPIGIAEDPAVARVASRQGALVVIVGDDVRLVQPGSASARSAFLTLDTAPGVQGLAPIGVVGHDEGFDVFYQAAGQLFRRTLRRAPPAGD